MPPHNPFFVGGSVPVDHFVGRTAEVGIAFDQISQRSHLALYGSAVMGKSSFLRFLMAPHNWQARGHDASEALIVYLNCTDINPFTPPAFWREVLSLLHSKAGDDAALQSEIDETLKEPVVEKGDLRRVLRKIGQRNKFLLLLLDDYNAALYANAQYTEAEMLTFLSEFRNLAVHSDEGRYFSTVVTSSRRLNELGPNLTPSGSPWYNHYLFQPLKPFTDDEVVILLQKISPAWTLTLEQQEGVRELADGHPALLQNACHLLYDTLRNKPVFDAELFARDFESRTEHFFRYTWLSSTDVEKMLLMLIALAHLGGRLNNKRQYDLGGIDSILSQMDRELRDLEERGVLRRTTERGKDTYAFASSIMEWWVIKEIENSKDVAELEQREKVFVSLSRKQVEQMRNVLQQVWHYKDAAVSIVGWAGKLVNAFVKGAAGG